MCRDVYTNTYAADIVVFQSAYVLTIYNFIIIIITMTIIIIMIIIRKAEKEDAICCKKTSLAQIIQFSHSITYVSPPFFYSFIFIDLFSAFSCFSTYFESLESEIVKLDIIILHQRFFRSAAVNEKLR